MLRINFPKENKYSFLIPVNSYWIVPATSYILSTLSNSQSNPYGVDIITFILHMKNACCSKMLHNLPEYCSTQAAWLRIKSRFFRLFYPHPEPLWNRHTSEWNKQNLVGKRWRGFHQHSIIIHILWNVLYFL